MTKPFQHKYGFKYLRITREQAESLKYDVQLYVSNGSGCVYRGWFTPEDFIAKSVRIVPRHSRYQWYIKIKDEEVERDGN